MCGANTWQNFIPLLCTFSVVPATGLKCTSKFSKKRFRKGSEDFWTAGYPWKSLLMYYFSLPFAIRILVNSRAKATHLLQIRHIKWQTSWRNIWFGTVYYSCERWNGIGLYGIAIHVSVSRLVIYCMAWHSMSRHGKAWYGVVTEYGTNGTVYGKVQYGTVPKWVWAWYRKLLQGTVLYCTWLCGSIHFGYGKTRHR